MTSQVSSGQAPPIHALQFARRRRVVARACPACVVFWSADPGRRQSDKLGLVAMTIKVRWSEGGVQLFDRDSGLNVLLDEVEVPADRVSPAPRYISVALTNACELRCGYCYAPKHGATLGADRVVSWAVELDRAGCLGVGFGGGEPTIHPRFAEVCSQIAATTSMAVTFTTHGHRLTSALTDALRGSVHFSRLSVDGVGATYERLRGRSFATVRDAATRLRSVAPIGINTVVNADTVGELDDVAEFAAEVGAVELLLLPERPTAVTAGISGVDSERLIRWIGTARPPVRLAISRSGFEDLVPSVEPIPRERPSDAHMHVDATGILRPTAYASIGRPVTGSILDAVHALKQVA